MLLATYQPIENDKEKQLRTYDCFRKKLDGSYPMFCFPARTADEFCFRSLLASPRKPERLLLFDTEKYVRFDAVVWNNIIALDRDAIFEAKFDCMFRNVDERFSEYVIESERIDEAIEEIEIQDFIRNGIIKNQHEEITEIVRFQQELAKQSAEEWIKQQGPAAEYKGSDLIAIAYQTAFVHYLGLLVWHLATNTAISMFELLPFLPGKNVTAIDEWNEFLELRHKTFDTCNPSTHQDYLVMCKCLQRVISLTRLSCFHNTGRNDPCPCGSGLKYKKCHLKTPVNFFPFLS